MRFSLLCVCSLLDSLIPDIALIRECAQNVK